MDDRSQDKLLLCKARKVWVGTDPLDRSRPALVWNPDTDRIIIDGVHAVVRGAFADAEGARQSARGKSHIRKLTKRVQEIDEQAAVAELSKFLDGVPDVFETPKAKVVKPHFKSQIRPERDDQNGNPTPAQMAEFRKNFDDHLSRNATGAKLA